MNNRIEELQTDIGINFDAMIPTEYDKAWFFYELGPGICPSVWFCYVDSSTKQLIPADCIERRKDIVIPDIVLFEKLMDQIRYAIKDLQNEYVSDLGKLWYSITYQLNGDGTFNISFSYDKPTGSLEERREKLCMEHIGCMPPDVTVDMLR